MIESGEWALFSALLIIVVVVLIPILMRIPKAIPLIVFFAFLGACVLLVVLQYSSLLDSVLPYGDHLVSISRGQFSRPEATQYYTPDFVGLYGWYLVDVAVVYSLLSYVLLNWLGKGAVLPLAVIFFAVVVLIGIIALVEALYAGVSAISGAEGFSLPSGGYDI